MKNKRQTRFMLTQKNEGVGFWVAGDKRKIMQMHVQALAAEREAILQGLKSCKTAFDALHELVTVEIQNRREVAA